MKMQNIFTKNLRTVSRNPSYFIILIICPIVLILAAGILINSINFKNFKVGIVNTEDYPLDIKNVAATNILNYPIIDDCREELISGKVNACLWVKKTDKIVSVTVYLDNSKKAVEYYAKQFVLKNILDLQTTVIKETFEDLNSKSQLFSQSIEEARSELVNASSELDKQENMLINYQKEVDQINTDFQKVYIPIKQADKNRDPNQNLSKDFREIKTNIEQAKTMSSKVNSSFFKLKSFLASNLTSNNYAIVSLYLNPLEQNITQLDQTLTLVNNTINNPNMIWFVDNYNFIMGQLDRINKTLYELDSGLSNAIVEIKNTKQKINYFLVKIDVGRAELANFSQSTNQSNTVMVDFVSTYTISSDNPILLSYPVLIAMILTFSSIILSNMFIIRQSNEPSYIRDIITPTGSINFMIGNYLINLFFISIQVVTLLLIGIYFYHFTNINVPLFLFVTFITCSIFLFIGMGIGYLVKNPNLSTLISVFSVMLLFVLSDILAPAVIAGPIIKNIIELNPFVIIEQVLFNILIINQSLDKISPLILKMSVYFILGFIGTYFARKYSELVLIKS